jgi:hypothetical protein
MDRVLNWRKKNPEKRKEQKKRERDRKFCKKHNIDYNEYIKDRASWQLKLNGYIGRKPKNNLEQNIKTKIIKSVKERCRQNNIEFNITREDIILNKYCPYLGVKLNYPNTFDYDPNNHSIDRINPNLGYVKGNIEIISMKANTIKNNASTEELIKFAEVILSRHIGPSNPFPKEL